MKRYYTILHHRYINWIWTKIVHTFSLRWHQPEFMLPVHTGNIPGQDQSGCSLLGKIRLFCPKWTIQNGRLHARGGGWQQGEKPWWNYGAARQHLIKVKHCQDKGADQAMTSLWTLWTPCTRQGQQLISAGLLPCQPLFSLPHKASFVQSAASWLGCVDKGPFLCASCLLCWEINVTLLVRPRTCYSWWDRPVRGLQKV